MEKLNHPRVIRLFETVSPSHYYGTGGGGGKRRLSECEDRLGMNKCVLSKHFPDFIHPPLASHCHDVAPLMAVKWSVRLPNVAKLMARHVSTRKEVPPSWCMEVGKAPLPMVTKVGIKKHSRNVGTGIHFTYFAERKKMTRSTPNPNRTALSGRELEKDSPRHGVRRRR